VAYRGREAPTSTVRDSAKALIAMPGSRSLSYAGTNWTPTERVPELIRFALLSVVLLGVGALTAARTHDGIVLLILVAVAAFAALLPRRLDWLIGFALASALVAAPSFVPRAVTIHGHRLFLAFALLPVASGLAARQWPGQRSKTAYVLAGVLALAAVHGYGSPSWTRELYGPVYLLSGFVLGMRVPVATLRRLLLLVLRLSAGCTLLAITLHFPLAGRDEQVETSAAAFDSTRYLSPATHLALATLCVGAAYLVVGRQPREALRFVIPAAVITFVAFSRNSIVALAVAVTVALVMAGLRGAYRMLVIGATVLVLGFGLVKLAETNRGPGGLPAAGFVSTEYAAYKGRVLGGLTATARSKDGSVRWRYLEDAYARQAWRRHALIGQGLGTTYRPMLGPAGTFEGDQGQHYVHNSYWWLLVKTGLLGLVGFLAFVGRAIAAALSARRPLPSSLAAGLVGLLVICLAVPLPNDLWGAPALGLLVGLCRRAAREQPAGAAT
jgi:hypothetical protein